MDFGPESGVDLEWISWGREKRPEKIRGDFVTKVVTKFMTKFVPVSTKTQDRICAPKSKIHSELPPYFAFWALGLKDPGKRCQYAGKGRMNKTLGAKKFVKELLRRRGRNISMHASVVFGSGSWGAPPMIIPENVEAF